MRRVHATSVRDSRQNGNPYFGPFPITCGHHRVCGKPDSRGGAVPCFGPSSGAPGTSAVYDHPKFQLQGGKTERVSAITMACARERARWMAPSRIYTAIGVAQNRRPEQASRTGGYERQSHKS
jgi:hypothetical protein